jgi:predicted enzyme related to lactoylglutathione lyase
MTAAASLLGRPLWYELMTTDVKGAEAFYRDVMGWTASPFQGASAPYTIFGRAGGAVVAGLMAKPPEVKAPPFWAMYVGVPSLEAAASHITSLGGHAHTGVIAVPSIGRMQLMMDPQGAVFYTFEPANDDPRPEGAPEIGDASWHELMTTDAPAAMTFYQHVFGWQPSEAMDMGPMGKYQMFNRPHGMIGGMMNKPPQMANVPSNWQIYFRVPDVDAATAKIKTIGGQLLNGPTDVPGGDRVASVMDPQGAAFGLHARKA